MSHSHGTDHVSTEVSWQQHRLFSRADAARVSKHARTHYYYCDSHCILDPIETANHGRVHGCAAHRSDTRPSTSSFLQRRHTSISRAL